jgi:molybdate transport system ATP-binding protein
LSLSVAVKDRRGDFTLDASFEAGGGVTALFGRSGAGKSTIVAMVAGLRRPQSGRIVLSGRTLFDSERRIDVPEHERHVGYEFQDARLFPHLTVRGNLRYGRRTSGSTRFAFDDVVALLGIGALLARRTANLSGGEAQRVAIGRALLSQPRILLLDEPLSNLDKARREELIPYLQRVRDETALPIVYVSHSADEVQRLTAAVHVLD